MDIFAYPTSFKCVEHSIYETSPLLLHFTAASSLKASEISTTVPRAVSQYSTSLQLREPSDGNSKMPVGTARNSPVYPTHWSEFRDGQGPMLH